MTDSEPSRGKRGPVSNIIEFGQLKKLILAFAMIATSMALALFSTADVYETLVQIIMVSALCAIWFYYYAVIVVLRKLGAIEVWR